MTPRTRMLLKRSKFLRFEASSEAKSAVMVAFGTGFQPYQLKLVESFISDSFWRSWLPVLRIIYRQAQGASRQSSLSPCSSVLPRPSCEVLSSGATTMSSFVKGLLATDSPLCYHPSASVYHITFNSSLLEVSKLEVVTVIRRHSFMRRVVNSSLHLEMLSIQIT